MSIACYDAAVADFYAGGALSGTDLGTMGTSASQIRSFDPAEVYEQFLVPAIAAPWARILVEHANPKVGDCVVDVACGTGIVAREVAPLLGNEGRVFGIDLNPAMLAVARRLSPPAGALIEWHEASALQLPLPTGMADLVLCQQGLQFFPDRLAALCEMRRVLKEQGCVVLSVWKALSCHPVYEAFLTSAARHLGTVGTALASPFSLGEGGDLRRLLEAAGFRSIKVVPTTHESFFPSAERFVFFSLTAAAAAVPAFAGLDGAARSEVAEGVARDIEDLVLGSRVEQGLRIPLSAHVAIGYV